MARNVSVTHVTLVMDGDYCHLVGFSPSPGLSAFAFIGVFTQYPLG